MKQLFIRTFNASILPVIAANFTSEQINKRPEPDLANVKYGEHERNVFDLWFADTTKITPLAIFIHGSSFRAGN
jgi:acetyl esterase